VIIWGGCQLLGALKITKRGSVAAKLYFEEIAGVELQLQINGCNSPG